MKRIFRVLGIVLALLLVVGVVVAWTLPARFAWRMAQDRLPSVQLVGIDGSVWHGTAERLQVASLPLGELEWELHPAGLLHREVVADFAVAGELLTSHGLIRRTSNGGTSLLGVQASLPAKVLGGVLGLRYAEPRGKLKIDLKRADIRNAWFTALDAHATWKDASLRGDAQVELGDILADFKLASDGQVLGTVHDDGSGPIVVDGTVNASPGSYRIRLVLRARNPDDLAAQEALLYLGTRQPDGSVVMETEGHTELALPELP